MEERVPGGLPALNRPLTVLLLTALVREVIYNFYYRSLTNWAVGITRVEAFRRTSRTSEQQLLRFGVLHRPGHRLNHSGFSYEGRRCS